jgi:DNA topoisomerase I
VHPLLLKLYEEKKLAKYLEELNQLEENDNKTGLTREEQILMKILKNVI